ncbi:MAG: hypothetical protein ACRDSN_17670 [Pseudonocardiaceae bacterium]
MWVSLGILLLACRDQGLETGNTRLEGTHTGVEYEAPRLIPGMRAQLDRLVESGGQTDDHNFTAYRGTAAALVDAMQSDLTRVGLADTGAFKALSDSIARDLGGGAGSTAEAPDRSRLGQHLRRMRSLIGVYEQWMRVTPK